MSEISVGRIRTSVGRALGASVGDVEFFEDGIETTVCVSVRDQEPVVVKIHDTHVYSNPRGFLGGPHLMKEVSDSGIPVPDVFYLSEEEGGQIGEIQEPYYIMEYLEGDSIKDLTFEQQQFLVHKAGSILDQLHQIEVAEDTFGWAGYIDGDIRPFEGGFDSFDVFLADSFNSFGKELADGGRYDDSNVEGCRFYDLSHNIQDVGSEIYEQSLVSDCSPCYCHWDLRYDNMLVDLDQSEVLAVIDWENPLITDRLYNIARVEEQMINHAGYNFSSQQREELREVLFDGYGNLDLDEKEVQKRMDLYRLHSVVIGMINFPLWFGEMTSEDQETRESEYRVRFERLCERLDI